MPLLDPPRAKLAHGDRVQWRGCPTWSVPVPPFAEGALEGR